jgi:ectoine hydroxylase-related dioxygenase (phytanoyl-CoA dioxygenase family)
MTTTPAPTPVDPRLVEAVHTDGFCILPDVLAPDEVARVRAAALRASERAAATGYPVVMEALDPGGRNVRMPDLPAYDPVFVDLAVHPGVTPYVTALLSDDWLFSNFSGNNALPGSRSMNAHNDQSTLHPEPWTDLWALNVVWCLDDVDEENGATRYLPGSHRFTRFSEVPADPKAEMVSYEARAGSVIVMHGRTWHTSGENRSADRERVMCFALYARGFLRLQANWWQVIPPEGLAAMSEEARLRFGLLWPNRGYGSYLVHTNPQPVLGGGA